jgi:hypothetical protein
MENITLVAVDCIHPDKAITAIQECTKHFMFGRVLLLSDKDIEVPGGELVKIPAITSWQGYSQFCVTSLHKYITTPRLLIVQHDGFITNPELWSDEFLEWDYIGAPFQRIRTNFPVGMNGGFSLRSLKLMQWTAEIRRNHFQHFHPEDKAITEFYRCEAEIAGFMFAPVELARTFAGTDKKDYSFGFHQSKTIKKRINNIAVNKRKKHATVRNK